MDIDQGKLEHFEKQLFWTADNAGCLRSYLITEWVDDAGIPHKSSVTIENIERLKSLDSFEAGLALETWCADLRESYAKVMEGLDYFESVLKQRL